MPVLGLIGLISVIPGTSSIAANSAAVALQTKIAAEHVFELPLNPASNFAPLNQCAALSAALDQYRPKAAKENCSPLTRFLSQYPKSPYAGPLWLELGLLRLKEGYYSRAGYCLNIAWNELKNETSVTGKAYGDRALAELALLDAHSGSVEKLGKLLRETNGRPVYGSATQRLEAAREAFANYKKAPGTLSVCATDALMALGNIEHKKIQDSPDLLASSGETSLAQFTKEAGKRGVHLVAVHRSHRARLIAPSIAHFKIGHYAVVTGVKKGQVLLKDQSFGGTLAMSTKAFNEESSGYFLTPSGNLPRGWSRVSPETANKIEGAGYTNNSDPGDTGPGTTDTDGGPPDDQDDDDPPDDDDDPCDDDSGMTRYNIQAMLCSLTLSDTPVGYTPAVGPSVKCTVSYSQKEYTDLPATSANFGPKWRFQFCSYVQDDPANSNIVPMVYQPGGGFTQTALGSPDEYTGAILTQTSVNPIVYTRTFPSGSEMIYSQSDGGTTTRNVYLTKVIDPQGIYLTLSYTTSSGVKLASISDEFGRSTKFSYGFSADSFKVTKITDPYGRSATFTYSTTAPYHLMAITDTLGITSSYTYVAGTDFITTLTTPYGTSKFTTSDTSNNSQNLSKWVEATDPLGHTERAEFEANYNVTPVSDPYAPNVPGENITNNYLNYRNCYYWNKLSYPAYASGSTVDYAKAEVFHFLHLDDSNITSGILESIKPPLENRQWYFYQNQTSASYSTNPGMIGRRPSVVARGLNNGSTTMMQSTVNANGYTTQATDAMGRTTLYAYAANNQDLLSIKVAGAGATTYTIWQASSYYKHKPERIVDSNGGIYTMTYNAFAQPVTVTNPLSQKTTYTYNAKGQLTEVEGPGGQVLSTYTYDSYDRIATVTDALGQKKTLTYDAADRVLSVTYGDGTTDSYTYYLLDLATHKDRQGRITQYSYNPLRQLISKTDPAGKTTNYSWCLCGHLGGIVDPNGNETTLLHDIEGRLVQRTAANGETESLTYSGDTKWPQSETDSKGQIKSFTYNPDGSLQQANYYYDSIATPSVSYKYDPYFPRITQITDGSGTRSYAYYAYGTPGGGRVSGIGEPGYDTMYFAYDALARRTEVETGTEKETLTYDTLGRVSSAVNPLGTFAFTFLGNSRLPSVVTGGPIKTTYDYEPLPDEIRLKSLENEAGSTVLDDFTYTYNPTGTIASWGDSYSSGANMGTATATYDADNRLTGWSVKDPANTVLADQSFTYDAMGNRETANTNGVADTYAANTVNGYTAESLPAIKEAYAYGYDANGSLNVADFTDTANSSLNYKEEFVYDGQNRLAEILNGTHESLFTYNSDDRVVKDVEYVSGKMASTTTYLWLGNRLLEEKTSEGTKYFYRQGLVETNGEKLYYTRDHLGSIREITESTGALVAKYQYDPWGVTTQLAGTYVSDLGFDGYLKHAVSGLLITPHRFYAPRMGRWLSNDPAGMHGGANLYGFDYNDPLRKVDPSGLTPLGAMEGVISYADLGSATLRQVSAMNGSPTKQRRVTVSPPGGGDSGGEPVEVEAPPYDESDPGDEDPPDEGGNYDDDGAYGPYYGDDWGELDPIQYWSDHGVNVYGWGDDDDDNNYLDPPDDTCDDDSSGDTTDDGGDGDDEYDVTVDPYQYWNDRGVQVYGWDDDGSDGGAE